MIQRNVRGLLCIADNRSHVLLGRNHLRVEQIILRGSQKKKKNSSIHQSAPIHLGIKGVDIKPTDLSSSTQGLPNPLHGSRQRYALKVELEGIAARLDAVIEQSYVTHPLITVGE